MKGEQIVELRVNEMQIPSEISFNYEELKSALMEKVRVYETMVYTDADIKQAKSDKATLNKLKKALNDERIRREKEYMRPFNEFKAQINEIIGIVDRPIALIDTRVKEYEDGKKAEKREAIERYFVAIACAPEWLSLDAIFNPRWMNTTFSMAEIEKEIDTRVEQIQQEMDTLRSLPEFGFEAQEVYKKTLDINKAIAEGKRLAEIQKRKAEYEAEQEKRRAAPPAEKVEEVEAEEKAVPMSMQAEVRQWVSFKAWLSIEDAKALKEFFTQRGIEFRAI
jgi:hypothetical protein